MKTKKFKSSCLPDFLQTILDFVNENIVRPAIAYRSAYGLTGADNRPANLKELQFQEGLCQEAMRMVRSWMLKRAK